ncbi:FecR domain-containing protein [Chitinophaga sp. sic0106]|uniref:FecR domain-containing protein n=1 Tax=Chitinophaga sp. sic0106 TaxID=2854785 RepID=UPI001C47E14E|nr:FecR domain-containing protein [Chitinophaga sp. sic0106]MBV7532977.1 FecR domain-containing protein [Chitinophaga sp. sic0106]
MKENQDLFIAIEKYLRGEASPAEAALVNQWYNSFNDEEVTITTPPEYRKEEIYWKMQAQLAAIVAPATPVVSMRSLWIKRAAVAASILVLISAGILIAARVKIRMGTDVTVADAAKAPVMPGSNKAVLILDDGSSLALNDSAGQQLSGASVRGQALVYDQSGNVIAGATKFNTLQTPAGGQFAVVLPDGSKAWLNAASSLRYPTAFTGNNRTVILDGEAYFEIAADKNKPFVVEVNQMKVQVLGTSFNIMAYNNENAVKTTLITGAVNVSSANATKHLLPGQQASFDNQEQFTIGNVDVGAVIAWKEGKFEFSGEDITVVLRQIARWYDLQLELTDGIPEGHLSATFPRSTSLENVMKMLELSGIHCEIANRKLIVRKS